MTTKKKSTVQVLTAEEYRERFDPFVLGRLLDNVNARNPDSEGYQAILREVPKIREALGQETLITAEVRENYAWAYARARDPYPYPTDIEKGRDEFNAWLAAHDAKR